MFEFLQHLDVLSSDYREDPGSKWPTIRVQDVRVTGGEQVYFSAELSRRRVSGR